MQEASSRIIRLLLQKLSEYDSEVVYKKGKENSNADELSRQIPAKQCCETSSNSSKIQEIGCKSTTQYTKHYEVNARQMSCKEIIPFYKQRKKPVTVRFNLPPERSDTESEESAGEDIIQFIGVTSN